VSFIQICAVTFVGILSSHTVKLQFLFQLIKYYKDLYYMCKYSG